MDYAGKKHLITKRHIRKAVLAGLMIFFSSLCNIVHALTWSPPQAIEGYINRHVDIALDPNNNWHLVYDTYEESGGSIKYLSSTAGPYVIAQDAGGNWVKCPAIDVDSNGGLHVIYIQVNTNPDLESFMYTTTRHLTAINQWDGKTIKLSWSEGRAKVRIYRKKNGGQYNCLPSAEMAQVNAFG